MNRIFINSELSPEEHIGLDADLSHHLKDVLRLAEGKQLVAVSKVSGKQYLAIIATARHKEPVVIKIISILDGQQKQSIVESLICALPKGTHADQICEQVAQFGVKKIVFWQAARSIAKLQNESSKIERWKKITEVSARQSQGAVIPEVLYFDSTAKLTDWLGAYDFVNQDLLAVCSLSQNVKMISELPAPKGKLHLVIGPEGDFTHQEEDTFSQLGAQLVSLGQYVLRVETAAVAAVSAASVLWNGRE